MVRIMMWPAASSYAWLHAACKVASARQQQPAAAIALAACYIASVLAVRVSLCNPTLCMVVGFISNTRWFCAVCRRTGLNRLLCLTGHHSCSHPGCCRLSCLTSQHACSHPGCCQLFCLTDQHACSHRGCRWLLQGCFAALTSRAV